MGEPHFASLCEDGLGCDPNGNVSNDLPVLPNVGVDDLALEDGLISDGHLLAGPEGDAHRLRLLPGVQGGMERGDGKQSGVVGAINCCLKEEAEGGKDDNIHMVQ